MKITGLDIYAVQPLGNIRYGGSKVGWVFVEISTDEGLTGVGECSNWPRRGNELVAGAMRVIRQSLLGKDPSHIERIWTEVFRNYTYLGSRGLITAVISGIDIALWDLKGKSLGRPVFDLLGGEVRGGIPLYTHPAGDNAEEVAASSRELANSGFEALKIDPFFEMRPFHTDFLGGEISQKGVMEGAEVVSAMRDAVGPEVEILIDAHGNFNVASAMRCIRVLEPFNLTWFEEPVPPEGLDALRSVRRQSTVPLCAGERLHTRWEFAPLLKEGLVDYIMPDVCWTGGISELKKISTMAETFFISVSPHNALGPIQILAGAHAMKTVPNFYRLEMIYRWMDLYNACLTDPMVVSEGSLQLNEKPGLGTGLNHDYLKENADPDIEKLLGN